MSVISPGFRSRFRSSIERPVAAFFIRTRLTPNALTMIGFAIAVVGAYFAATQSWLFAGLIVAFGAVFDLFDGALARATNRTSKLGAFMDSTFDRAGEAVVYIGIAVGLAPRLVDSRFGPELVPQYGILGVALAMVAMTSAFLVSYTRAKSDSLGFSTGVGMANVGLAPREVRTGILVVALVFAGIGEPVARSFGTVYPYWTMAAALALIAILAAVTTIQRILFVYQQSKSEPK